MRAMKPYLLAGLLLSSAAPVFGQQPPAAPPAPSPAALPLVDPKIAALRDAALKDEVAWDIVEGLTTEVGARVSGTESEARARDWAVAKLKALGFSNVRVESFDVPLWIRGEEKAWITAPFPQRLIIGALGNSGATPPEGTEAEIVAFDSVDALAAAPDTAVRGKIVFVDHAMPRTEDGSGYGFFGRPRREGPSIASSKGALAIVVRSIGTDDHRNPHTGTQRFTDGVAPIPAAALPNPDADQLKRILARGRPVRMKLVVTPHLGGQGRSGNVIAEVPGRDPTAPVIMIGGHLDCWDYATGAIDDAAGIAITTAAAKRIMDSGRPLRTIRIVWFGSEEPGILGGLDYQAKHGKEPHWAIAESDFGADRVWRVNTKLGEARAGEAKAVQAALAPLGIVPGKLDDADGSDIGPMIQAGIPAIALSQDGTRVFDLHHTPDDTLDKIDPVQLRQNVAAWTAALAVLSGGIEPGPKQPKRR